VGRERTNLRQMMVGFVLLGIVFAVTHHLYENYWLPSQVVRSSDWNREISAGVRAIDAGKFEEAEMHFGAAQQCAEDFDDADARRGTTLHDLADLRLAQHRYKEAGELYSRALAILEKDEARSGAEIAMALAGYATVYAHDQNLPEAERVLRRAVAINEHLMGSENPKLARSVSALAGVILAQGRAQEASALAMRAAALRAGERAPPATAP
jgi:tetratricopeptide (TPR) repeat protein